MDLRGLPGYHRRGSKHRALPLNTDSKTARRAFVRVSHPVDRFWALQFHQTTAVEQVKRTLRNLSPSTITHEHLRVSPSKVDSDGVAETAQVSWRPKAWVKNVDLVVEMDRVGQCRCRVSTNHRSWRRRLSDEVDQESGGRVLGPREQQRFPAAVVRAVVIACGNQSSVHLFS